MIVKCELFLTDIVEYIKVLYCVSYLTLYHVYVLLWQVALTSTVVLIVFGAQEYGDNVEIDGFDVDYGVRAISSFLELA